jgi:hypothetical protein
MTLADVLDGAFKLLKANFRSLLVIAAVFIVPVQVVVAFAQRNVLGGRGFLEVLHDPSFAGSAGTLPRGFTFAASIVSTLAQLLVLPLVAGAISRVVAASYLGQEAGPGPAIRAAGRRWWALVAAWFLVHLVEGVGLVLCVLPGLLAMALFVGVAPAIVAEGLGPIQGMRRSARLLRPRVFAVLGIAVLVGILSQAIGGALGFVPTMVAFLVGMGRAWPVLAAGASLVGVVTTPIVAIVATLVYLDGRIRQEGLDLQLVAAELAGRGR